VSRGGKAAGSWRPSRAVSKRQRGVGSGWTHRWKASRAPKVAMLVHRVRQGRWWRQWGFGSGAVMTWGVSGSSRVGARAVEQAAVRPGPRGQRFCGTRRWSRLASRRQSRRQPGVVRRQRQAIAFVDSGHRSHTSVWVGVSVGRAGRVVARRQLGHCTIARMLVSFRSVAEVGDRHLLVASGVLSGSPCGGQRHEASHRALTRQARFMTRTGCLIACTNKQVYRMQSLRLRS
jgi:hypothetical protein